MMSTRLTSHDRYIQIKGARPCPLSKFAFELHHGSEFLCCIDSIGHWHCHQNLWALLVLLWSGLKTADRPDWTDFGLDQTTQAVCSPKTEKYGPDHGPNADCMLFPK